MQKAKPTDDAFRAIPDHDKIKLRAAGYGLVYRVTVVVVAVGPQSAPFGLGQDKKVVRLSAWTRLLSIADSC